MCLARGGAPGQPPPRRARGARLLRRTTALGLPHGSCSSSGKQADDSEIERAESHGIRSAMLTTLLHWARPPPEDHDPPAPKPPPALPAKPKVASPAEPKDPAQAERASEARDARKRALPAHPPSPRRAARRTRTVASAPGRAAGRTARVAAGSQVCGGAADAHAHRLRHVSTEPGAARSATRPMPSPSAASRHTAPPSPSRIARLRLAWCTRGTAGLGVFCGTARV